MDQALVLGDSQSGVQEEMELQGTVARYVRTGVEFWEALTKYSVRQDAVQHREMTRPHHSDSPQGMPESPIGT
jgi:hypothetical protein